MIFYLFLGILLGIFLHKCHYFVRQKSLDALAKKILNQAELEAKKLLQDAKQQVHEERAMQKAAFSEMQAKQRSVQMSLDEEKKRLKHLREALDAQNVSIKEKTQKVHEQKKAFEAMLEVRAAMSQDEAKQVLLEEVQRTCQEHIASAYLQAQNTIKEQAITLLCDALCRLPEKAIDACTKRVVFVDPSFKAKIIGKEGKNLKHFKKCAHIDIALDSDTQVLLFCPDPFRLEIACAAMKKLVHDGRICPQTIDEALKQAREELQAACRHKGYETLEALQITDMHPELVELVGKMHVRTTLGQNLLEHSIEVSRLMAMIACELGLDVLFCARIGLLHDLGKCISCDAFLSHAKAGEQIAKQYGESQDVAYAIGTHHDAIGTLSNEAKLLKACDALSSMRMGARRDTSKDYFKKLEALEALAKSFDGVRQAFALQGGKELSVFVHADVVDDLETTLLAQKIAKKIRQSYGVSPQITVTREVVVLA